MRILHNDDKGRFSQYRTAHKMVDTLANGRLVGDYVIIVQQLDEIELISNRFGTSAFSCAKTVFAWTPSAVDGLRNRQIAYTTAGDIFTKKFDYEKNEFIENYVGVSRSSPADLGARWISDNVINRH